MVVAIATIMSTFSGTVATRVARPTITSAPQTISAPPTNGAESSGTGMPDRPCWSAGDHETPKFRITMKEIDADHFVVTLVGLKPDGSKDATMETTYARKK
ncbi:MAG: hypothetical protein U1E76_01395 [Planctomycetota bacterium]